MKRNRKLKVGNTVYIKPSNMYGEIISIEDAEGHLKVSDDSLFRYGDSFTIYHTYYVRHYDGGTYEYYNRSELR